MNEDWEDPRKVLARHGLAPKRGFSQNFLISPRVTESIAAVAAVGLPVLELGPGLGTLTQSLLAKGCSVCAIERDRDMIRVLGAELAGNDAFEVREGDATDVDITAWANSVGGKGVVAGNLPYSVTGSILRNLVHHSAAMAFALVMVQREVKDRLVASPGTKEFGALTVFTTAIFKAESVLTVPPSCFHPAPKVSSAVVKLTPHAVPRAEETAEFRTVVRTSFAGRRKTLRNALQLTNTAATIVDASLVKANIDGRRRGETLSVEEFGSLARAWREFGGATHVPGAAPAEDD